MSLPEGPTSVSLMVVVVVFFLESVLAQNIVVQDDLKITKKLYKQYFILYVLLRAITDGCSIYTILLLGLLSIHIIEVGL